MSKKRIDTLRRKYKKENLNGLLVTNIDHIRYLTGFTGSAGLLLISSKRSDFFTDFRYKDQAARQVQGVHINIVKTELIAALKKFPQFNIKNITYGYAGEYLSVSSLTKLKKVLPDTIFVATDSIFENLGWVKEKSEIASIIKAVKISDIAYERILNIIKPGIREKELAAELEYQMTMLGSEKPAFETIVASGYRSALPHGIATNKKLKKGELVTFDFGATCNGYVSDITRTIVLGNATTKQKKIYNLVLKAQMAGIKKIRAGIMAKKVDEASRNIITRAGYGKNFGHGTGHGIGYYVHVGPRVSQASTDKLMTNNVITVEPGIYISGWGGVRIEDDVVITKNGGKVLNKAPKNLLEL